MPANDSELPRAWERPIDPVEAEAAAWLVRRDRGLSAEEAAAFSNWLEEDPVHARLLARLDETWGALDRVPASRVPAPASRWRPPTWAVAGFAAAAAVAVVFVGVGPRRTGETRWVEHAAAGADGFKRIDLPDGSIVRLNAGSEVDFDFGPAGRRVRLRRGEASFTVAKDPKRPFVVRVGQVDVRAVGTAFNVRWEPDGIEVLVTEGRVRLDEALSGRSLMPPAEEVDRQAPVTRAPAEVPVLEAGQRATIATAADAAAPFAAAVTAATPADAARVSAWHTRRLEFTAQPLADIVAEFNRYNRHQLVIDDPELARQRFGGRFQAGDREMLVRLLELNLGVRVERRPNETLLRGAAPAVNRE